MPRLKDRVLKKKGADARSTSTDGAAATPEAAVARIANAGSLRTGIVTGLIGAVVSLTGLAGTMYVAEQHAESAEQQVRLQDELEDAEELESIVCSVVYARVHEDAAANPDLFRTLVRDGHEESFFSAEERQACPEYRSVVLSIQP